MSSAFFHGNYDTRERQNSGESPHDSTRVTSQNRTENATASKLNSQAGHKNASKMVPDIPTYLPPTEYKYVEARDDMEVEVIGILLCHKI